MSDERTITVAEVSDGPGGTGEPGTDVSLPVVELLTGRGFVTGKSGSGKSNTASVIAENLLDSGFGLLIVDIDGEYYGLKEEYEILHVGADEECDIQVTTEHAEKIANLALEQNVPIILDISSFLDEDEAEALLTEVSKQLFAKAKKLKQPFLMLVEEVHEWIPENGSVGEVGKMLIKIGKRGRKHGLGIVGISQRPADVKKDFITQCDWLVWHRLTWDNDTKVVRRVLDGEYAAAVEDLDDGEGFLMTDWSESVRRVRFQRKRTFDAGATPGLEDFERPELKSVSDDLVSELEAISDERSEREDRIAELREELDRKNSRIAELERELQDAREIERLADQFVDALVRRVEGPTPGRTEQERTRDRHHRPGPGDPETRSSATGESESEAGAGAGTGTEARTGTGTSANGDGPDGGFSAADVLERLDAAGAGAGAGTGTGAGAGAGAGAGTGTGTGAGAGAGAGAGESTADDGGGSAAADTSDASPDAVEGAVLDAVAEADDGDDSEADEPAERDIVEADGDDTEYGILAGEGDAMDILDGEEPLAVRELKADVAGLDTRTRKMLAVYRERGPETPPEAHVAAGGDGDRTNAYAHNRTLRTRGLIGHVGRGHYDYRLRDLLRETFDGHADEELIEVYARKVEDHALDVGGDRSGE